MFRDDTAFVARRATEVEQAKWAEIHEQDSQRRSKRYKNSAAAEQASSPPIGSPCESTSQLPSEARRDNANGFYLSSSQCREATRQQQHSGILGDEGETIGNGGDQDESSGNYEDEDYVTSEVGAEPSSAPDERLESEAADGFITVSTLGHKSKSSGAGDHTSETDGGCSGYEMHGGEAIDTGSNNSPTCLGAVQSGAPRTSPSSYDNSSRRSARGGRNESLATSDSPMFSVSFPSHTSWFPYHCSTSAAGHGSVSSSTDWAIAATSYESTEPIIARADCWGNAETSNPPDLAREAEHLRYWRQELLPRLPSVFADIESIITQNEVVRLAVLALSASRLTGWGTREHNRPLDQPSPSSSMPDISESFAYYSQALRAFATSRLCGFAAMETCVKLVALLLFSYMELTLGTMHGSYSHILKCDEVVRADYDSIMRSPLGIKLVIEWAGLRARHATDTLPFHPRFARAFAGSLIQADIDRFIDVSSAGFPFLSLRLSNVYYASDLLLLLQIVGSDATSPIYRTWRGLFTRIGRESPTDRLTNESPSKLLTMLDAEKALLNEWHKRLPLSNLPVESFCSDDFEEFNMRISGLQVRPLRFITHKVAMQYLLYACAQVYASRSNLERCRFGGAATAEVAANTSRCGAAPIDPWILLMLRILAGMDVRACLVENTFECGTTWIVLRMALRCCSLDVLTWLGNWLLELEKTGATQEGSLPIRVARQAVAMISAEHEKGRVVNLIFTSFDQFQEKQMLCRMSFEESRPKAVIHGTTQLREEQSQGGDTTRRNGAVPFVDVI